jgi:hypothetical protein
MNLPGAIDRHGATIYGKTFLVAPSGHRSKCSVRSFTGIDKGENSSPTLCQTSPLDNRTTLMLLSAPASPHPFLENEGTFDLEMIRALIMPCQSTWLFSADDTC